MRYIYCAYAKKRIELKKKILYIIIALVGFSAIAQSMGDGAFGVWELVSDAEAEAVDAVAEKPVEAVAPVGQLPVAEAPADTVKVRKTDYLHGEHPEDYSMDLDNPENLKQDEGEYDDKTNTYKVGTRLGKSFLSAPTLMSPQEYLKWTERASMDSYFKQRNDSLQKSKGKSKFDFSNMHFNLGPAEKIFGPGGVQIKTQGSAEIKLGYNYSYTDNPALSERSRKVSAFDFDEKINISVNAKVGDKMNFNVNYNTDATFDFDTKNLKLAYEGKEDDIVKLIEAGNVTFPTNSSLIKGASSLFGFRTDLQFGKLNLQAVLSQKKSQSKTVGSQGGSQLSQFEIQAYNYDENRHFFLAHYFHDTYDRACSTLPNITSGVTINRIEVWLTNTSGVTTNTRDIIGFVDLAEHNVMDATKWMPGATVVPANASNNLYSTIVQQHDSARNVSKTTSELEGLLEGGVEYEKIENARLLTTSDYTLNKHLGYISLKTTLQPNQCLAVAYEYTYGGQTYQVGEFSSDLQDNDKAMFVKLLKSTSSSPSMRTWRLMMKNVYSLGAQSVQKEKFKLDIKYLCDTTGVYLSYIPEEALKQTTILKMMNLDRLDNNNKNNPNGRFDFVEGYTVNTQTGRVIFPVAEPFGKWLRQKIVSATGDDAVADKYCYDALYDTTKTAAKQIAEKNKFILTGEYKASSGSEIDLGSMNIPQGSVTVTAGGVTLTEGSDYTVDYTLGKVTIINQSIIDAGTNVSCSLESQSEYQTMRKTMVGLNWTYDFSKNFQIGGTFMRLTESPLTSKVNMGEEPLNNILWGVNMNWKQKSQWLTNMIDKIPLIHASAPSNISFQGEFAQLVAGKSKNVQGNASYLDDFENTRTAISVLTPTEWILSSTPADRQESKLTNDISYGYNRSLLAWYQIDPLFTQRSSSLTPSHIKADLNQLSNHYVREVYIREVYPNRETNYGESNTLNILNMAYYPQERGPYNLNPNVDNRGRLFNPKGNWGGMMRKLDTSDFETSNVQYIEFWMLDPFIYSRDSITAQGNKASYTGDLFINLGEVSEDVLKDGKKSYESGMPVNDQSTFSTTVWGRVPNEKSVVYSFSNESGARQRQDIGLNGLSSTDERDYVTYREYYDAVKDKVDDDVRSSIWDDPAGDDYHYFRGSDFDDAEVSILDRYKRINSPEGNSPNSNESGERYSTAYKSTPDCEDVNMDYTMNEYEKYFRYRVSIDPDDLEVGKNHIVDERKTTVTLRNGKTENANWYLFRIPIEAHDSIVGGMNDLTSVRFMRMYLTNFERPVVLRFASLDLVRGEWREYKNTLYQGESSNIGSGTLTTAAVNIEENNDKTPVNYVLPPGVSRVVDPSQPQITQANEQALAITVENLASQDAKAVYKTTNLDLRNYKHIQMFIHANSVAGQDEIADKQMSVFVRLGSDYKNNFYEYEIPVNVTPARHYDTYSADGCEAVWPRENMLDIDLRMFTDIKHSRNVAKAHNSASYTTIYRQYDPERPNNRVSVMGNPSLGEVKTIMIGVRNNSRKSGSVEVWVNELRLQDYTNEGGWAAQGNMNVQLSDIGSVNVTGHVETAGFGGIEEKVNERRKDNLYEWSITTQLELGRLFPEKWKMQLPFYYSYSWQKISPKYNPFDTDMLLRDAMKECADKAARDSLSNLTESVTKNTNLSLSNWKSSWVSRKPMPYDPANFALSYSFNKRFKAGETTVYEKEENWKAGLSYSYSPKIKAFEPFKKIKGKSKWLDIIKAQNLTWLPQNISFNTDMSRQYYEFQERDLDADSKLPVTWSSQFLWNRDFSIRWDIFKALKISYTSATHAEVEEPYRVVNKNLYPDDYSAWKDSVKQSLLSFGRPLTYKSTFSASYTVPLNKIPVLDWVSVDGSYATNYGWTRGTELEDGRSLGHVISTNRNVNVNGKLNFETLYKKWKFLADVEKRFSSAAKKPTPKKPAAKTAPKPKTPAKEGEEDKEKADDGKAKNGKKSKGFTKEITLNDSTMTELKHGLNSKRLIVRAVGKGGKTYTLKYKKKDANTISIKNLDTVQLRVNVTAKPPLEDEKWYKAAQVVARGLMLIRNASISYRNTYALTVPGFRTEVGDAFGQRSTGGTLSPGLDFAFGLVGDGYLQKAANNGWLMQNDSNITTPATSNTMEDLQVKVTLEPVRDLKIDLNATRTRNKANSVQFMYAGMPTVASGSFNQSMISIGTAFSKRGNIDNNYANSAFDKFLSYLPIMQSRVQAKYEGLAYPLAAGNGLGGKMFDAANGGVNMYSADVMVPAFLAAYGGGNANSSPLEIFPTLWRMLPNWSLKYGGLVKLPWFSRYFKSFNINHAYKSVYSVGAYNSFTGWMDCMNGLGFISDVTSGNPIPSSMYNVSTVSINESFSPLIGVDMTFNNGLTAKAEFKKIRTLNLSMTSVALTENFSDDIVVGLGYKIKDISLFGAKKIQDTNTSRSRRSKNSKNSGNANDDAKKGQSSNSSKSRRVGGVSHDLNLRFDFSYRMQSALNRNIATAITTATNGSTAYKLSLNADYTFSRLLTLSAFLDWQRNVPLVSQSSYPTTTADFGINIKVSLAR